jgi:hypothetical protein
MVASASRLSLAVTTALGLCSGNVVGSSKRRHPEPVVLGGSRSRESLPAAADSSRGCVPPHDVREHVARHNMSLLEGSATQAVYGSDDGEELSLYAFDCLHRRRLLFLHIPKNAGTTIEAVAHSKGVHWGKMMVSGQRRMADGNWCSNWHIPPALLPPPNPYTDPQAEVFCVTRDPWERMISEYVYLLQVYSKWPFPYVKDGPPCTKKGLNTFVGRSLARVERGSRYIVDCHMLPQWDYVETQGKKWCQHPLPIEHLTEKFNELMVAHGLQLRLKPHNKHNSAASKCPSLKSLPLSRAFDPAVVEAMRRVYARDFAHLGDSLLSSNSNSSHGSGLLRNISSFKGIAHLAGADALRRNTSHAVARSGKSNSTRGEQQHLQFNGKLLNGRQRQLLRKLLCEGKECSPQQHKHLGHTLKNLLRGSSAS